MRLFLILPFIALVGSAQPSGTFTPTGSMTTSRIGYSATLLPNGKVLIAGGVSGHSTLASTELYDPATGVFTPAANMTTARGSHSAVLLPNGKVLIAGGGSPDAASAELYDPATGVFAAITGLLDLNQFYYYSFGGTSVLLPNGLVLLVSCCQPQDQLYDPSTGTFSFTGGIYDPGSFSFTNSDMGIYADGFGVAQLANGNVLVSGGFEEETNTAGIAAAFYDWRSGVFVRTGDMTMARYYHSETTLGDGTVLIAGSQGLPYIRIPFASAEIYDPAQGVFSATANMITGRYGHRATLLLDGRVLISGSADGLQSAEIYTPSVPVPAPTLFQGGIWHAATGQIASADNPVIAGEALSMYTTSLVEGGTLPPQVSVGGRLAEIVYFGDAPGYPGYFQINFRVPDRVSAAAAAPVRLTYLGRPSNEVTIAVQ